MALISTCDLARVNEVKVSSQHGKTLHPKCGEVLVFTVFVDEIVCKFKFGFPSHIFAIKI